MKKFKIENIKIIIRFLKIIYLKKFENLYKFIEFIILRVNYKYFKIIYIIYIIIYHIIEFVFISEKGIY